MFGIQEPVFRAQGLVLVGQLSETVFIREGWNTVHDGRIIIGLIAGVPLSQIKKRHA